MPFQGGSALEAGFSPHFADGESRAGVSEKMPKPKGEAVGLSRVLCLPSTCSLTGLRLDHSDAGIQIQGGLDCVSWKL